MRRAIWLELPVLVLIAAGALGWAFIEVAAEVVAGVTVLGGIGVLVLISAACIGYLATARGRISWRITRMCTRQASRAATP